MEDYLKFLHTKLYMIECIARKGTVKGDEDMKEILNLCMASPSKIENMLEEKCSIWDK